MRWANLHALWALAAIPFAVWLFVRASRARKKAVELLGDSDLIRRMSPSLDPAKRTIKTILVTVAIGLIAVALARPQVGTELREVRSSGRDVVFVLDVSASMLAQDVPPSRIGAAKAEIGRIVELMKGDRVGLVIFSGEPFAQCPLTMDTSAFRLLLDIVDVGSIPTPGTDIAAAIEESLKSFQFTEQRERAMVLVTDGEDHSGEAIDIAKKAAEDNVAIYTIGLGKPGGGAPIPIKRDDGSVEYKRDSEGNTIMTVLGEETLKKISNETGGKYYFGGDVLDLNKLYADIAKDDAKSKAEDRFYTHYEDRFQWLLVPALLLLLIEAAMSERGKSRLPRSMKTAALLLFIPMLMAFGGPVVENIRRGNELLAKGNFADALSAYTEAQRNSPGDPRLDYNIGAALYGQGKYAEAREAFNKATLSESADLKNRAWYNIGNSFVKEGSAKSDIDMLQMAAEAYEKALEARPDDEDSKFNLEVVRKMIELKKQEQEQEQKKKCDNPNQNPNGESQQSTAEQKPNESPQSTAESKPEEARQSTPEQQSQQQQQAQQQQGNEQQQGQEKNVAPGEMTREDAERILRALEDKERENLNERMQNMRGGRGRVLKDW